MTYHNPAPNQEVPPDHRLSYRPQRSWPRRIFWAIVILAILGGIVWICWSQNNSGQPKGGRHGAAGGPMPVVAATAQKGDIAVKLNALGTVTPLADITVKPQISGILTRVGFQEGQMVHEGDFLAEIDPRPYQLALEQAQGQLTHDQALLKDAQLNLDRYKVLIAQDSIAQQQVDTQAALVMQYQGTVQTDKAAVDNARLNLVYCHITAPVTGRVGIRAVDPGNYVASGTALVTVTQIQPISVIFTLPEDNLPAITQQLGQHKILSVAAYDRSQTTKLADGRLSALDNQVDTSTGTVRLRAIFDNPDGGLFPNQFVNAQLLVDTLHDQTVIPSAAVQRGAPGTFVYLIQPDDTVTIKIIKLGQADGDNIAVTDGLAAGDKIVVDGADKLKEGSKVTLPQEKEPQDNAAQPDQKQPDQPAQPQPDQNPDQNGQKDPGDQSQHHHHHKQPQQPQPQQGGQ